MTVDEWLEEEPEVTLKSLANEVIEWRARANEYKVLFQREVQAHAGTRSKLNNMLKCDIITK